MKKKKTNRGFIYYESKDLYGAVYSIQESSLATEAALWMGLNESPKPHHVTMEPLSPRMHINIKMAKKIVKLLNKFIETGYL